MSTATLTDNSVKTWLGTLAISRIYEVHRDTVWDWMRSGIKTPAGVVKLQARKIGGRWKSTREWVEAFFRELDYRGAPPVAETPQVAEARAKKDQEEARKRLGRKK